MFAWSWIEGWNGSFNSCKKYPILKKWHFFFFLLLLLNSVGSFSFFFFRFATKFIPGRKFNFHSTKNMHHHFSFQFAEIFAALKAEKTKKNKNKRVHSNDPKSLGRRETQSYIQFLCGTKWKPFFFFRPGKPGDQKLVVDSNLSLPFTSFNLSGKFANMLRKPFIVRTEGLVSDSPTANTVKKDKLRWCHVFIFFSKLHLHLLKKNK